MDTHRVLRLDPDDPEAWAIWPEFEDRLRKHSPEVAPDTPVDQLIRLLRKAFAEDNPLFIMVIVLSGGEIIGHCLGWHEAAWSINYAIIHQAKLDEESRVQPLVWKEIIHWVRQLNALGANPPIEQVRFVTTRGEAWARRLKQQCTFERVVISLDMDQLTSVCEG
jgi:hypothetical protein